MINQWMGHLAYRQLVDVYGAFTALAMLEDAAKADPNIRKGSWKRAPVSTIIVWSITKYPKLWRNADDKVRRELYKPL